MSAATHLPYTEACTKSARIDGAKSSGNEERTDYLCGTFAESHGKLFNWPCLLWHGQAGLRTDPASK